MISSFAVARRITPALWTRPSWSTNPLGRVNGYSVWKAILARHLAPGWKTVRGGRAHPGRPVSISSGSSGRSRELRGAAVLELHLLAVHLGLDPADALAARLLLVGRQLEEAEV